MERGERAEREGRMRSRTDWKCQHPTLQQMGISRCTALYLLFSHLGLARSNSLVRLSWPSSKYIHILQHKQVQHNSVRWYEFISSTYIQYTVYSVIWLLVSIRINKRHQRQCNWLNMQPQSTHAAVSILKDCWRFRRSAPSLVTREKTNIWSVLILLIWGGAKAKHTSRPLVCACVGVLEVQRRPGGEHHSAIR